MKYVIFDFDGTVADTLPHIVSIAEDVLDVKVQKDEIEDLRNTPATKIIKKYKIPIYKIPKLIVEGRKQFTKHIDQVRPVEGIGEVIRQLHKKGYVLQIISSNSVANIKQFLTKHKLDQFFVQIHGSVGLFSKAQAIRKVIRIQKIDKNNCIYIGDEVRDIEAAKKVGIKVVSVTSGLNGDKILAKSKPNYLAKNPSDILKAVDKLSLS